MRHSWRLLLATTLVILAGLLAFALTQAAAGPRVIYQQDFEEGPERWETVHYDATANFVDRHYSDWTHGRLATSSLYPVNWWVDNNQLLPEHMVLFTAIGRRYGADWGDLPPPLDLSGLTWRVRIRASNMAYYGSQMIWWVQTWDPAIGRWANLAMTGKPLVDKAKNIDLPPGQWVEWEASPTDVDWSCLGVNPNGQVNFYGCGNIHDELRAIRAGPKGSPEGQGAPGLGIFLIGVNPQQLPIGTIEVDWVELLR